MNRRIWTGYCLASCVKSLPWLTILDKINQFVSNGPPRLPSFTMALVRQVGKLVLISPCDIARSAKISYSPTIELETFSTRVRLLLERANKACNESQERGREGWVFAVLPSHNKWPQLQPFTVQCGPVVDSVIEWPHLISWAYLSTYHMTFIAQPVIFHPVHYWRGLPVYRSHLVDEFWDKWCLIHNLLFPHYDHSHQLN